MAETTYPPITIPNSRTVKIYSKNVDQEYELSIALPPSYGKTDNKYPVLYLLDSNYFFTTIASIIDFLYTFGPWDNLHIPEMIIVGIGYPATGPEIITYRSRDYTPVDDTEFYKKYFATAGVDLEFQPNSGRAPEFLKFVTEELLPYIEKNYRAYPSDRAIAGHSYGGLFPSYVLFKQPETFHRYVLSSPSLWYKDQIMFEYEEEYAKIHDELIARVFISAGANESKGITEGYRRMVDVLGKRNYKGLQWEHFLYDDEVHFSVYPASFTKGIISVFKP